MSSCSNIRKLKALSRGLLNAAFMEIRSYREKTSPSNTDRYVTAEYLLQEAMEYVTGAWEMVKSGKHNASIALSRWVLEASLNLQWTAAERDKIEERHNVLIGEALRKDACLLEGLAKLWPDKKCQFISKANEARRIKKKFSVEELDNLANRLKEIKLSDKWYSLYRICCAAAHPNLKVRERFGSAGDPTVSKDPINKQSVACWMAAASTLYLVASAYCLTGLGDPKQQKDWWETKVRPLLNYD